MGIFEDNLIGKRVYIVTLFFILLGSTLGYVIYQSILDPTDISSNMTRMVEYLGIIIAFYVGSHKEKYVV